MIRAIPPVEEGKRISNRSRDGKSIAQASERSEQIIANGWVKASSSSQARIRTRVVHGGSLSGRAAARQAVDQRSVASSEEIGCRVQGAIPRDDLISQHSVRWSCGGQGCKPGLRQRAGPLDPLDAVSSQGQRKIVTDASTHGAGDIGFDCEGEESREPEGRLRGRSGARLQSPAVSERVPEVVERNRLSKGNSLAPDTRPPSPDPRLPTTSGSPDAGG